MNSFQKSDAFYLLAFFLIVIALGTTLLLLPGSWQGPAPLNPLDAFFTAASAVCVAGLGVVDITAFSPVGLIVIMLLIQIGGLGIISFSSILLTIPGNRLAIMQRNTIQGFYIDGVEYQPRRIVQNIIGFTVVIEAAGALLLALCFRQAGVENWIFMGVFHAVSAFCNAGISPLADGLIGYAGNTPFLLVLMTLVVLGGLGFIVLQDILEVWLGKKQRLSYHSRIVLVITACLILGGTALIFVLERKRLLSGMVMFPDAWVNALFQSVTTRSGGFEVLPQSSLSQPSKLLTGLLMLIGGAPGSIAGGLKITTVFVVFLVMFRKPDEQGDIKFFHHRLTGETLNKGVVYVLKALALLLVCIAALTVFEGIQGKSLGALVFEVVSAFGTVGLTLSLTPSLSAGGKLIIIAAMFAGRVGLVALAFPAIGRRNYAITYPEGSILLG
ncbi:trk/ktr system potassium uptake protein [Hollandina sp. SP2]